MSQHSENALAVIGTPGSEKKPAPERPLPMDEPAMDAAAEPVTIELTALVSRIAPPRDESAQQASARRIFPIATAAMIAALIGAMGGAAATAMLWRTAPDAALVEETQALQDTVGKLSGELAAVKSGIETANRTAAQQLGKIGERLDRAEKAQAEPAAKLAKIAAGLDRLEKRAVVPDVTGSVTGVEKHAAKPAAVEGWRLVDFYAGRAVLEGRNGVLYEVVPGANLPGVGRIETIKRIGSKIVVTTPKGIITSSLESQRRTPYFLPRGY